MKKWLLILGMITCMAGMSACGKQDSAAAKTEEQVALEENAKGFVESLNQVVEAGQVDQYAENAIIASALDSWQTALEDMGDYRSIESTESTISDDGQSVIVHVTGTKRNAKMEIIIDSEGQITTATTTVVRTMSELMKNAALNTLLGMGTVFVVLILISLIISGFNLIPKIQKMFSKKKTEDAPVTGVVAQIMQNEEQTTDDFELIAVISAAIAASEGAASSDGYVVRSIRRIR